MMFEPNSSSRRLEDEFTPGRECVINSMISSKTPRDKYASDSSPAEKGIALRYLRTGDGNLSSMEAKNEIGIHG